MGQFKGKDFSRQKVVLDGNKYENCNFQYATIIYNGGPTPELIQCDVSGATVAFGDAAERTALFLKGMSTDPAMSGFVRQLFPELIR